MRNRKVLWSLLILVLVAGCATLGTKPWTERTPKEKSSYFMALYNRQYADTMAMATSPALTEAQKKVVRTKKETLTKLWPAIQAYDTIAVHGGIPTFADEQAILDMINRLAAAGG